MQGFLGSDGTALYPDCDGGYMNRCICCNFIELRTHTNTCTNTKTGEIQIRSIVWFLVLYQH